MPDCLYTPHADGFLATELTRGPWDPGSQHASPPAALLGRAITRHVPRADLQVARLTFDILRPVPIGVLSVSTTTRWEGRSVWRVDAAIRSGGVEVMRATSLLIRAGDVAVAPAADAPAPPGPETGRQVPFFPVGWDVGYHTAMQVRFIEGSFLEAGPAVAWMRMRVPLVADEEPSGLTRVLMVADTGNGASASLDFHRYLFVNPDLTVHLHRYPRGEWVCLDASTAVEPSGIGLATSTLSDLDGVIGRGLQSLFISER